MLEHARAWGLTNRRNLPLTSHAIGVLLKNRLYAGIVDVPEYGVRGKRGDLEPLISEDLFYRGNDDGRQFPRKAFRQRRRGLPALLRGFAATAGNLRLVWVNRSTRLDGHPRYEKQEGWLANRSSLTNAGERRLVAQIFPRWNRLQPWFELVGAFKDAA